MTSKPIAEPQMDRAGRRALIKRAQIIDAAISEFCERGYASTRMADVAKRAAVSYGLIYHYFGSKEILFESVVSSWWDTVYGMLETERDEAKPVQTKLENMAEFMLSMYESRPEMVSIFITEVSRSSNYHAVHGLVNVKKAFTIVRDIMLQGQQSGLLSPAIPAHYLTYIFVGVIESMLTVLVLGAEPLDGRRRERMVGAIIKTFLNGAAVR